MPYARYFSGLSVAAAWPGGAAAAPHPVPAASPCRSQRGIGALGLICPSGLPGETWRIRETWASSRARPRCTDVSGCDSDGSASLLTELVSAEILRASPERVML